MTTSASSMMLGLSLLLAASSQAAPKVPTTRPVKPENGWSPRLFEYDRPATLVVEESTPTAAQAEWRGRPPQLTGTEPAPADKGPATPRAIENLNITRLTFKDADGEIVPALLCTPKDKTGPFPVVVAVHGLTSHKMQVCAQVAPALCKRGFAVLAPDLPRHGERPGEPRSVLDRSNLAQAFKLARQAAVDVRQCIDIAESRKDLDTTGGVTLVGYSMGSWVNSVVGPADDRVNAMVLMVGGAHDLPAAALLLPQVAATDVRLAIAHFVGRPLLMLNGKSDFTVTKAMADRLFAAAPDPKKQVWYDSGHFLSSQAYEDAAEWITETVKKAKEQQATDPGPQRKAG